VEIYLQVFYSNRKNKDLNINFRNTSINQSNPMIQIIEDFFAQVSSNTMKELLQLFVFCTLLIVILFAMIKTIKDFFAPTSSKEDADITMKGLLQFFAGCTLLIATLLAINFYKDSPVFVFTNTALLILATSISGFLVGFIFGIPRSVRFRFDKTKDKFSNLDNSENFLADNTNLEEISDWITKIIIGLTLIEGRKIIRMIENGADSIAKSYPKCGVVICDINLFVFSYCLIVFFVGYGLFGGYFWARTLFGSILIKSRKEQETLQREITMLSNRNLSNADENDERISVKDADNSLATLKRKIAELFLSTTGTDPQDTQKGRWGGLPSANNRTLTAKVQPSLLGLYDVIIEVVSTDSSKPLTSTVVVLLDSTFVENEIYLKPINNVAKVSVVAYEAFTIAAICDNLETRLELDLQQQKGLPPKFYYGNNG
jgi:hypothetical protein